MKNNGTTVPKITQNLWSIFRNDMSVQMCTYDFNLLKPRVLDACSQTHSCSIMNWFLDQVPQNLCRWALASVFFKATQVILT